MIKNLNSSSPYLHVYPMGTLPTFCSGRACVSPITGALRYNDRTNNIEVYDGYTWIQIIRDYNVQLSLEAEDILAWARSKMREEQELETLAEDNPTIRDLLKQQHDIEEKIKVVKILIKEKDKVE